MNKYKQIDLFHFTLHRQLYDDLKNLSCTQDFFISLYCNVYFLRLWATKVHPFFGTEMTLTCTWISTKSNIILNIVLMSTSLLRQENRYVCPSVIPKRHTKRTLIMNRFWSCLWKLWKWKMNKWKKLFKKMSKDWYNLNKYYFLQNQVTFQAFVVMPSLSLDLPV